MLTSLICGRILYYAHGLQKQFGPGIAETYFRSASIIIESALPYTLSGIAFVVSNGLNSDITILFLSLYAMFMASGLFLENRTALADNTFRVYRRRCSFFGWRLEGHGVLKQLHVLMYHPCNTQGVRTQQRLGQLPQQRFT